MQITFQENNIFNALMLDSYLYKTFKTVRHKIMDKLIKSFSIQIDCK